MITSNKFFLVQNSVKNYKDAEFSTLHPYTFWMGLCTCCLILTIAVVSLISGFTVNDTSYFITAIGFGAIGFIFAISQNIKPVQFVLKAIVKLIWGNQIDTKIFKIKRAAIENLGEYKDTIFEMEKSSREWQMVANQAISILRQENIFLIRSGLN